MGTFLLVFCASLFAQTPEQPLRVGISGTAPFVVTSSPDQADGIAVEIWEAAAAQAGWAYKFASYESVPQALMAMESGNLDAVVGPVSITAERIQRARFSLPYFVSSLGILSRTETPTLWQRLSPFFSESFFYALTVFFTILTLVGAIVWLVERKQQDTHFPMDPLHGIGNGIWFAIVTMSTVGYGDLSPKSVIGRFVTGSWIVISLVMATSLIAGIASTLTLSSLDAAVIESADQLSGRDVAVIADSPGEDFARRWGARIRTVNTLADGYSLLQNRTVDAIVFDRPQLQYFLDQEAENGAETDAELIPVAISASEYESQDYGFALPLDSELQHPLDVELVRLSDSGIVGRIIREWLGEAEE